MAEPSGSVRRKEEETLRSITSRGSVGGADPPLPIILLCPHSVEEYRALGREDFPRPACPRCAGRVTFHGSYERRWREDVWDWESGEGEDVEGTIRVRRVQCTSCGHAPALLPGFLFGRRRDLSEVIIRALFLRTRGGSLAQVVKATRRPWSTVRDQLERFKERLEELAQGEAELAVGWGWKAGDLPLMSAERCLALLGILLHIQRERRPWTGAGMLSSAITGGWWLGTNTSPVLAVGRNGFLMATNSIKEVVDDP